MFNATSPPETPRPILRPAKSTGWSWPRLVTVHEAQAKPTTGSGANPPYTGRQSVGAMDEEPPLNTVQEVSNPEDATLAEMRYSMSTSPDDSQKGTSLAWHDEQSAERSPSTVYAAAGDSNFKRPNEGEFAAQPARSSMGTAKPAASAAVVLPPESTMDTPSTEPRLANGTSTMTDHSVGPQVGSAIPTIKIQGPSRGASEAGPDEENLDSTSEHALPDRRVMSFEEASQAARERGTDMVAVVPHPTDATQPPACVPVQVKKRKTALRKARNLAARNIILKATLGRQLAVPTKEALRRLAKGEDVAITDITVVG